MIPKKIHYVWVGGKEKPKDIKRCMSTWTKHLKGYEIKEWNESNFDINSHPFVKKAYEAKKWAFVSDYIRAYAIYNEGGIYLDTDVLVLKPLDDMLNNKAFVGFETNDHPFTAVFGAESGHPFVKDMLDYYDNVKLDFKFKDNNTISVSDLLINKYGCKTGNIEQLLDTGIKVYKRDILCGISNNSYTIHVFMGSWLGKGERISKKIHGIIRPRLTSKFRVRIYMFFYNIKNILKRREKE